MSAPSHRQRRQGRHRRQHSLPNEALYVPRGPSTAENQNLTQLERQWSHGHEAYGTPLTSSMSPSFLSPDIESPFASTWASPGSANSSFVLGPAALHRDVSASPSLNNSQDENAVSSVIHDAARITNWRSVLQLCRSNPEAAQYAGPDGWTALHHACNRRCPQADVAEALIRAYPDALLEIEEKGMTPLHYACRFKAPKEVVRLLLHLYPARGRAAVSARDKKGRTPLYYAVRYDAPPGVVELLLEVDPSVVLEEDRNADSPLALVWDSWAEKFEGKKTLQPFLHPNQPTDSETLKEMMNLRCNEKLLKKWKTVTLFLRAAFGFHKDGNRTFRALLHMRLRPLNATQVSTFWPRRSIQSKPLKWMTMTCTEVLKTLIRLLFILQLGLPRTERLVVLPSLHYCSSTPKQRKWPTVLTAVCLCIVSLRMNARYTGTLMVLETCIGPIHWLRGLLMQMANYHCIEPQRPLLITRVLPLRIRTDVQLSVARGKNIQKQLLKLTRLEELLFT